MRMLPPRRRAALALPLALLLLLSFALVASANVALTQVSSDPYTNSTSQHRTQVEPDTYSFGNTVVSAFQSGRFTDGGASNIGWGTSLDNGATWTKGFLPGITKFAGGTYDRVSDPAVAYDPKHGVWLIASLPLKETPFLRGAAVVVSRSTDGGLTWGNPVTVVTGSDLDKDWIACDTTSTSPFYGNCYVQWDDHGAGNTLKMSTSNDGGLTWGAAKNTANNATGIGGQPLVQPTGRVVVPAANANETAILSFISVNGGGRWRLTNTVSGVTDHAVAGGLRTGPLPSADMDGAGKVFVVWQDCRFRTGCASNDIVMSTSTDGVTWSAVSRIPIDATNSGVDHFLPGLAIDRGTSGGSAHLALLYYYYPNANCSSNTCQLDVGFVSSTNGGATWSAPTQLAGPMSLSWLANTTQGRMVGDYMSSSYAGGLATSVFAVANAPAGGVFDEAMYAPATGMAAGGSLPLGHETPVTDRSDHPAPAILMTRR